MLFDVEIPEWARWIAQDESGGWYAYENEPTQGASIWLPPDESYGWVSHEEYCHIAKCAPPADWTQELYEVEWK